MIRAYINAARALPWDLWLYYLAEVIVGLCLFAAVPLFSWIAVGLGWVK